MCLYSYNSEEGLLEAQRNLRMNLKIKIDPIILKYIKQKKKKKNVWKVRMRLHDTYYSDLGRTQFNKCIYILISWKKI